MTNYKATVFLPQTTFPMRGTLQQREPEILQFWNNVDLYHKLRQQSQDLPRFILHDGPPYANGHIHIGHAVNKVLKDVTNRSWQMLGYNAVYVPGWDCHGLPIEWKVEEKYRSTGKDKNDVPIIDFREQCREFAEHWITVQSEEFQQLGVLGDWRTPYTTLVPEVEAQIIREIHTFVRNKGLYRKEKPVLWSVVEKTALADAEVEYHDHTSHTIFVRFPLVWTALDLPEDETSILIWTTTPWTIPGNRAIAYDENLSYGAYEVCEVEEGSMARVGEVVLVACSRAEQVVQSSKIRYWRQQAVFQGSMLAKSLCRHPFAGHGYEFTVPLYHADFVTGDVGTGFVHVAPGHGDEDYAFGLVHGIEVIGTVDENGAFYDTVPLFAGRRTYTENGQRGDADHNIIQTLREHQKLLAKEQITHSYPHSWRSKAPLIFRSTSQWFISMSSNGLREKALQSITETQWIPSDSRHRLRSMVSDRPDWCISRQRSWGVPIAIFVRRSDGVILDDPEVLERIASIITQEGSNAWFVRDPQDFLGESYKVEDFEQVRDIVDVWFESGSTHSFVLEVRKDLCWPASLYLEGSDQHRGWFQSSLLQSCGTRGRAPYQAVLTHGFVLDEYGRKMSKSLNNVISPQQVIQQHGADILRLWVISSDYFSDLRIGTDILKHQVELYRRIRNVLRYLLGALHGFTPDEKLPFYDLPELEQWVLHQISKIDSLVRTAIQEYDFHTMFMSVYTFCTTDLSAFYFDICKDSLYCDHPTSRRRRAIRTVMALLFSSLTAWLAPILCFTTEEAWKHRPEGIGDEESVHLRLFPTVPEQWSNETLDQRWQWIRNIRKVVTGALEQERMKKVIGSSLQASPVVYVDSLPLKTLLESVSFHDITLTSGITIIVDTPPENAFTLDDTPHTGVLVRLTEGQKCQRCWKVCSSVGTSHDFPDVCERCTEVLHHLDLEKQQH